MWTTLFEQASLPCYNWAMNSCHQSTDAAGRDEARLDAVNRDEPRLDVHAVSSTITDQQDVSELAENNTRLLPSDNEPNEQARPDAAERDAPRLDAVNRDETRSHATGRDGTFGDEDVEPEALEINWLDVEQTATLLNERGISRTIRTIQKMCKRGDFDAKLVPTENGVRYIINDQSIEDFITRHNQKLPSSSLEPEEGQETVRTAESQPIEPAPSSNPEPKPEAEQSPEPHHSHLREIISIKDEQIDMLQSQLATANNQIAMKDEQIGEMLERGHETNHLIQNLQRMIGLPERRSSSRFEDRSIDIDPGGSQNYNSSGTG